jgi:hypothetical protein
MIKQQWWYGGRAAMETVRLTAAELFEQNIPQAEVARSLET